MAPTLRLLNLESPDEVAFMFEARRHPLVASQLLGQAPANMEQHVAWLSKNHKVTRNIYLIVSEKAVGYCQMLFMPNEEAELGWVVHPDHQSKGYGRFAVGALIEEAFRLKFRKLCLYVKKDNDKATRLYESFGFKLAPSDNPDVLFMRLFVQ